MVIIASIIAGVMPAGAHPEDVYELGGSGWGHSIGLSQYGALGQALEGRSAEQILAHYYVGTSVETTDALVSAGKVDGDHPLVTNATPLWVGVVQNASSVAFAPVGGDVRFCQAVGEIAECVNIGAGDDGSAETWVFAEAESAGESGCLLTRVSPALAEGETGPIPFGSCRASIIWDEPDLADRVGLDGAACAGSSGFDRNCFNRGTIRIRDTAVDDGFHIALEIGVEEYLYGLGEMPSAWSWEALKAQAMAGRTFAIYRLLGNERPELATPNDAGLTDARKADCWCHIYSTVRDQSYVGYAKEGQPGSSGGSRWLSAVDATAGRVVTHPTATAAQATIVLAFYHSSSGGITETNTTVWGTSPQPYLQSVDDSWSNSDAVANPFETWTFETTAAELAGILGWESVSSVTLANGAPGASFAFEGRDDGGDVSENVSAAMLYAALGTRSPHIDSVAVDPFYPFLDIEGTVHTQAIFTLWEAGITNGCMGEYYCPERALTRAQMATLLARSLDLDPSAEEQFVDVDPGSVHAPNINAVADAGISIGCDSTGAVFCPDDLVTRAQMATFLSRALDLEPGAAGPFSDIGTAGVHAPNINAIWRAGITAGCSPDGTRYCPDEAVTRAQMATFLVRALFE